MSFFCFLGFRPAAGGGGEGAIEKKAKRPPAARRIGFLFRFGSPK
jgi:hypothetical protein